jgi:hypothetical protein
MARWQKSRFRSKLCNSSKCFEQFSGLGDFQMSMFRNLLKSNSSSYIRLSPSSLDYTPKEEVRTLVVESNDKWTLTFKERK